MTVLVTGLPDQVGDGGGRVALEGALSVSRVESAQKILVRLDGVVYLLDGHPLEVTRRVEGPAFRGPADGQVFDNGMFESGVGELPRRADEDEDEDDEDGDRGGDDDGDLGDDGEDGDLPLWPVVDPVEPTVVNLVLRPARVAVAPRPARSALGDLQWLHGGIGSPLGEDANRIPPAEDTLPSDRMDEASARLCMIDERTGLIVVEIGVQWYRRAIHRGSRHRVTLPLSSGSNILPGMSAQIASRPQHGVFRPMRLIIGGTPGDWIVNDVRIGNRSQFSQSGDIPGDIFSASSIDTFVMFETVQAAMDVVLIVTYVGASESGAPFVGALLGEMADSQPQTRIDWVRARRSAIRWTPEGRLQGWMIGLSGEDENRDFNPGATGVARASVLPAADATPDPPAVEDSAAAAAMVTSGS